jgi:hypothetical protein
VATKRETHGHFEGFGDPDGQVSARLPHRDGAPGETSDELRSLGVRRCANKRPTAVQQSLRYSITSSAAASIVGGR